MDEEAGELKIRCLEEDRRFETISTKPGHFRMTATGEIVHYSQLIWNENDVQMELNL